MTIEPSLVETSIKDNLEQFLIVLSVSLSVATISRLSAWFRQIPYTLLLVIVGLGLSFIDIKLVNLSPELILEIFLPPLLFEAAWNTQWRRLRDNWLPVTLFVVIGSLISVVGVGLALYQYTSLSLITALLVGASVSSTDPVSVVALFRELGASERLTTLMEGESLFNDGVSVVAFILIVGIPLGIEEVSIGSSIGSFFTFVGIGVGMGVLIGFGLSYLTQRFDLPVVEQSLTLVAAYGTYLFTEELGGSGVIGVVTVGLVLGNFGSRIGMSPRTRLLVSEFWEFLAFFVNSIVFLLIGDQINIFSLSDNLKLIGVAIAAMLVSRFIGIFGIGFFTNWLAKSDISWQEQTVLWWGGLRGSVSIALALSVPVLQPQRQAIIDTVFGAVVFTLLFQGLTTKFLLVKLNLIGDQPVRRKYAELLARRVALKRVLDYLTNASSFPEIDPEFYLNKEKLVKKQLRTIEENIDQLENDYPQLRTLAMEQLSDKLVDIESDTYAEFIRAGRLNNNLTPLLQEIMTQTDK